MSKKIKVKGQEITILQKDNKDYISLTDMVRNTDGDQLIKTWLKSKNTIEFLGVWESMSNTHFNMVEFDHIKMEAGTNRFVMSVSQWVAKTNAIGLMSKMGKTGGTYAHKDIAFHFAMWISPEFNLLVIKEFERLKELESKFSGGEWDYRRFLSKVNYRIHTDAIKENIIPVYSNMTKELEGYIYANEAELLNVAVFGKTSKQWRDENPDAASDGKNMRDLANIHQLTVMANLESYHSVLIKEGKTPKERLEKLKDLAVSQLRSLSKNTYTYSLESPHSYQYEKTTTTLDENLKNELDNNLEKESSKLLTPVDKFSLREVWQGLEEIKKEKNKKNNDT